MGGDIHLCDRYWGPRQRIQRILRDEEGIAQNRVPICTLSRRKVVRVRSAYLELVRTWLRCRLVQGEQRFLQRYCRIIAALATFKLRMRYDPVPTPSNLDPLGA